MQGLGFSVPVLLQQLLRSMEDTSRPRTDAVTYAVLSLIVRLVATQSSVVNLWFSRRCYERSRGEMITMIFEKTLGRKIIGAVKKSTAVDASDRNGCDPSSKARQSTVHSKVLWSSVCRRIRGLFSSNQVAKDMKEPASMGKILNLMR